MKTKIMQYLVSRKVYDSLAIPYITIYKTNKKVYKFCLILGVLGSTLIWISVICLGVHISIYTALKKLRNAPAQILLALACALCPAQIITTGKKSLKSKFEVLF